MVRETGSWAHLWKISAAYRICQFAWGWGVGEEGSGGEAYVGTGAALQLGLDFPGKGRLAVFMQDYVVAFSVEILGINE